MSETYTPDNLFAGDVLPQPVVPGTLASGQDLDRGALVGKILRALGGALVVAGGSGDGTITNAAMGAKAQIGLYTLTAITVSAPDASVFSVHAPNGERLADAVAGTTYDTEHIGCDLTNGDTDFVAGDSFTVEIEDGSGSLAQADSTAVDGTELLFGVLADDCDASLADVVCEVYEGGEFNDAALGYAGSDDADTWADQGRALGIIIRENVATDGTY